MDISSHCACCFYLGQDEAAVGTGLAGSSVCPGGYALIGWEEWEKPSGELFSSPLTASVLTLLISFFLARASWNGWQGGPFADGLKALNQMNNRGMWQSWLGMRHGLGGWHFCSVILEINTMCWCVALLGIASESVGDGMVGCTLRLGDMVSKDDLSSTGG